MERYASVIPVYTAVLATGVGVTMGQLAQRRILPRSARLPNTTRRVVEGDAPRASYRAVKTVCFHGKRRQLIGGILNTTNLSP